MVAMFCSKAGTKGSRVHDELCIGVDTPDSSDQQVAQSMHESQPRCLMAKMNHLP